MIRNCVVYFMIKVCKDIRCYPMAGTSLRRSLYSYIHIYDQLLIIHIKLTITPPTAVPHHINIYTYIVILSVTYNINVYNIYMYCNNYLFTFFNIQSTSKLYIIK